MVLPVMLVDKSYKNKLKPYTKMFVGDYYVNLNASKQNQDYIENMVQKKLIQSKDNYIIDNKTMNLYHL